MKTARKQGLQEQRRGDFLVSHHQNNNSKLYRRSLVDLAMAIKNESSFFFFAEILSLDQNFPFNLFSTKCFAETNAKLLTSIMDVPSCFIYILLIKNSRSFIYLACGIKILIFQSEQNHYFICDPITSKMPVFAGELM